jgi:hypothetical protein
MNEKKAAFFARTMHTPDTPERAALREALRETSRRLIPLHRALIEAAKEDYGFPVKPAELLHLLTDDPFFAWLRPMTALIVAIDEMARTDFEPDDAFAIGERIAALFDAPEFSQQYVPILQRNADVAIGHVALKKASEKLRRGT